MARKTKVLTNLELSVMRVIWTAEKDALTVREVCDLLNAGRAPKALAYTTVQTMLGILVDKGFLKQRPGPGRAHTYAARRSQDEVARSMVGDLVERLFDGQAKPLLAHLLDHGTFDRTQLADLKQLIEDQLDDEEGRS